MCLDHPIANHSTAVSYATFYDLIASDEKKIGFASIASDETFDERIDIQRIASAPLAAQAREWTVPGEEPPVYEELRDIMLYMGGPVNYDRYVDPAICRRLIELDLVTERRDGTLEFTLLGANVYSSLTAGNEAPELLGMRAEKT